MKQYSVYSIHPMYNIALRRRDIMENGKPDNFRASFFNSIFQTNQLSLRLD